MEDQETLDARAGVRHFPGLLEDLVDDLLAIGVMAACVIIRGIFFTIDNLLGVIQLVVPASTNLICNGTRLFTFIEPTKRTEDKKIYECSHSSLKIKDYSALRFYLIILNEENRRIFDLFQIKSGTGSRKPQIYDIYPRTCRE